MKLARGSAEKKIFEKVFVPDLDELSQYSSGEEDENVKSVQTNRRLRLSIISPV